jgi:8-oxo-dGTP diphosphatase
MAIVHVAVGVIVDANKRILIARRPDEVHQGGLWEFPGGKVETSETVEQALARELHEELGIAVGECQPLLKISHDYGDKQVLLDVWLVESFTGTAVGREGQPLQWVAASALEQFSFPAANVPIAEALVERLGN